MTDIDAVVYDFGGVFMASPFEAIQRLSDDKGITFEVALALLFGPYDEDTDHPWHRAERGELDVATAREAISVLAREQDVALDLFELFNYIGINDGIDAPMVDSVRRARAKGCKTAILTNNIIEAREAWKALLPVDELFDAIVDSSELGMRKPDPRIFQHALAVLGDLDAACCVFLDDYPGNVRAAKDVGMIGILVEEDRSGAIDQLDELLAG